MYVHKKIRGTYLIESHFRISYQLKTDNSVIIGVSKSSIAKIQIDSNPLKITVLHNDIITSSILGSHLYFEEVKLKKIIVPISISIFFFIL